MRFDIKAFGIRIKMLRYGQRNGNKKLTQEQMAVDLNISEQFLRKIEYGQRCPSIRTTCRDQPLLWCNHGLSDFRKRNECRQTPIRSAKCD